jgi:hypothetical protein
VATFEVGPGASEKVDSLVDGKGDELLVIETDEEKPPTEMRVADAVDAAMASEKTWRDQRVEHEPDEVPGRSHSVNALDR